MIKENKIKYWGSYWGLAHWMAQGFVRDAGLRQRGASQCANSGTTEAATRRPVLRASHDRHIKAALWALHFKHGAGFGKLFFWF